MLRKNRSGFMQRRLDEKGRLYRLAFDYLVFIQKSKVVLIGASYSVRSRSISSSVRPLVSGSFTRTNKPPSTQIPP